MFRALRALRFRSRGLHHSQSAAPVGCAAGRLIRRALGRRTCIPGDGRTRAPQEGQERSSSDTPVVSIHKQEEW
jgi:hypothetical protein